MVGGFGVGRIWVDGVWVSLGGDLAFGGAFMEFSFLVVL